MYGMMGCPTIADGVGHSLLASLILLIVRYKRRSCERASQQQMSSTANAPRREMADHEGQSDKVRKTLRGRAEKACVRCRAKKRTCDGGNPCQRCKESHSACYFSDWHYTVPYPREYVEYLEEQQEQLSAGLLVMYRLLKDSHIKTVPPLPDKLQAQDLLSALRSLRLDPQQHHPIYNHGHHRNASGLHNGNIMNMSENVFAEYNRRPPSHVHSPFDPGPASPTSVLSSSFHSPRPDMNAPNIPTTAPASFPPVTYGPAFEFARPAQPKVVVNHTHTLPSSDHATSPGVGLSSGFVAQEPWHPDGGHPLSPMEQHALQHSRRPSGESPSPGFPLETGQQQQQRRHDGGNVHSPQWAWNGETGLGVGLYGSSATNLPSAHDSHGGMDWESIEQRGEIAAPHDSHAQHLHGKWHGGPLN